MPSLSPMPFIIVEFRDFRDGMRLRLGEGILFVSLRKWVLMRCVHRNIWDPTGIQTQDLPNASWMLMPLTHGRGAGYIQGTGQRTWPILADLNSLSYLTYTACDVVEIPFRWSQRPGWIGCTSTLPQLSGQHSEDPAEEVEPMSDKQKLWVLPQLIQ